LHPQVRADIFRSLDFISQWEQAVQKSELKDLIVQALDESSARIVDHTPTGQNEYFDLDIRHQNLPGGELHGRFFMWELTPDESVQGRPPGEHKLQLTLGSRSQDVHNFPTTAGRQTFLLGYSQENALLVGFQSELHKNFGWSKLVAVRDKALVQAKTEGWATHLRGMSPNTGQRELVIAFKPPHIVDWLRFQVEHPDVYGPPRQSAANSWLAKPQPPAATPLEAIRPTTVPQATPQEVVRDPETLGVIAGDVQITTTATTAMVEVNIADRIAATNRHNQLLLTMNNKIHGAFGEIAFVIDRDLPGHRRTYAGATLQPDLGFHFAKDGVDVYVIVEAKSLPTDTGGQWRQIMIAIGELARYSMVYNERFNAWPTRVLGLERLPADADLQRFLQNLHDNEDICVVWPKGDGFQTFSSHQEGISWLADPVE
jgi:hypothetical protein